MELEEIELGDNVGTRILAIQKVAEKGGGIFRKRVRVLIEAKEAQDFNNDGSVQLPGDNVTLSGRFPENFYGGYGFLHFIPNALSLDRRKPVFSIRYCDLIKLYVIRRKGIFSKVRGYFSMLRDYLER